jgi:nucleotide-binding universal stress UspA family protein
VAPTIIVSYDGTANDTDALALGQLLAGAGGSLALAYVRHAVEADPAREAQAQADTEALLEAGATWLGDPDVPRHVVVSGSTPEGLRDLAEREHADLIVFGSEYRTSPGGVQPGTSALRLLEGGPIAVALAPAGFSGRDDVPITTVATIVGDDGDPGPRETAESLAAALKATVIDRGAGEIGVAVVGSKPGTAAGRVTLSAAAQYLIEMLRCPVLVLPHGVALRFGAAGGPTEA